jgi:hypothetical protein
MTAPTVAALLKAQAKLKKESDRLAERVEVLEGMTSAAGDHGNASHTPDFQPAGGYSKGQLLAADVTGLLNALGISTDGFVLTLDAAQTLGVKWGAAGGGHTEDHDHDGSPTQQLLAANTHQTPAADTHHPEAELRSSAVTKASVDANHFTLASLLSLGAVSTPTIAAGNITITGGKSVQAVSPESGTADDLDTITGGVVGNFIFVFNAALANDITLRHNIGATANRMLLLTERNFVLESGQDGVWLYKPSTSAPWIQVSHPLLTGTVTPADVAAAAAVGTNNRLADASHVHAHPASQHASGGALVLYSRKRHVNVPDAAKGATVTAGDAQGAILHSGPNGETADALEVDAETAPGASGLPVTWQYADTNDLDTAASWTTIATLTLSSEKSARTTSMTNAAIPANRVIRMNIGTIVGTPKDVTSTLHTKEALVT